MVFPCLGFPFFGMVCPWSLLVDSSGGLLVFVSALLVGGSIRFSVLRCRLLPVLRCLFCSFPACLCWLSFDLFSQTSGGLYEVVKVLLYFAHFRLFLPSMVKYTILCDMVLFSASDARKKARFYLSALVSWFGFFNI